MRQYKYETVWDNSIRVQLVTILFFNSHELQRKVAVRMLSIKPLKAQVRYHKWKTVILRKYIFNRETDSDAIPCTCSQVTTEEHHDRSWPVRHEPTCSGSDEIATHRCPLCPNFYRREFLPGHSVRHLPFTFSLLRESGRFLNTASPC